MHLKADGKMETWINGQCGDGTMCWWNENQEEIDEEIDSFENNGHAYDNIFNILYFIFDIDVSYLLLKTFCWECSNFDFCTPSNMRWIPQEWHDVNCFCVDYATLLDSSVYIYLRKNGMAIIFWLITHKWHVEILSCGRCNGGYTWI